MSRYEPKEIPLDGIDLQAFESTLGVFLRIVPDSWFALLPFGVTVWVLQEHLIANNVTPASFVLLGPLEESTVTFEANIRQLVLVMEVGSGFSHRYFPTHSTRSH